MPWTPSYTESQLRSAVERATQWADVLLALGIRYHGKSIATARKWASEWDIDTEHLPLPRDAAPSRKRYSDAQLREAVARNVSWAAVLRDLGYCPTGSNGKTIQRRCAQLAISTHHFDQHAANRAARARVRAPLSDLLVEGSTYHRSHLKARLFEEGVKERRCEQCGQGETWRGRPMSLILDHINGVRDDNRLENLQIVCPNCAATLDTHCGRGTRRGVEIANCAHCESAYEVRFAGQRFCSRACSGRARVGTARRVARPEPEVLRAQVSAEGYVATGRRYGVSDNAVRKWLRGSQAPSRKALPRGERR